VHLLYQYTILYQKAQDYHCPISQDKNISYYSCLFCVDTDIIKKLQVFIEGDSMADNDYYKLEEVKRLLGKSQATIYREAEAGLLPYELPDGKKIGMRFPKEAIDVIAKRERAEQAQRRTLHLSFVPSTPSDVWAAVSNARYAFGEDDSISFERALEWRDRNPDISMSVRQQKQFVGMATVLPLDESVISPLIHDKLRERDIPLEAIRPWTDTTLSVYVAGISIIQTGNAEVDRQRGRFLIYRTIKWCITLTSQYDIKKWYAVGTSPEGQGLLEQLGFQTIVSLDEGQRKGYVLEQMFKHPTKLAQRFLSRLE
jgi:predicted DNA-binding transcriptional regulator AlpA